MVRQKKVEKEDKEEKNIKTIPKEAKPIKPKIQEQKFEVQVLADALGINKYDFFLICKKNKIGKNDFITESELVELYNKIIRR